MSASVDTWHFIFDDAAGTWTWRRIAPAGELVSESDFSFQSFNVCLADATRAGYHQNTPYRRVRSSELVSSEKGRQAHARGERRRSARAYFGSYETAKIR